MNALEVLEFEDYRLEIIRDGDSFRVAAPGLAKALGFREAYDLVRNLPEDEKRSGLVRTIRGDQQVWYVTEAGFFRAIGQRQPARITDPIVRRSVERFQELVYSKILPEIRRTGSYGGQPKELSRIEILRLATESEEARLAAEAALGQAEAEIIELTPPAEAWKKLGSATGDFSVEETAKTLSRDPAIKIGQGRLFAFLVQIGWVYRGRDSRTRPYQTAVDAGLLCTKIEPYTHPHTGEAMLGVPQIRVTHKGLTELRHRLDPGVGRLKGI